MMEKIPSFRINHLTLMPGVYVSRMDNTPSGDVITTYDIRMTAPNREPAMSVPALHAMEHLAATYLRNRDGWKEKVVYWGPMGCCTGNYFVMQGKPDVESVMNLMKDVFSYISTFEGDIPGASPRDCGNFLLMSLPEAKYAAMKFLSVLESGTCPMEYPD